MIDEYSYNCGVIYACAQLIRLHDQPGMAADIFLESNLKKKDLARADSYDSVPVRKACRENHVKM